MRLYTRFAAAALLLSGCQGSRTIGGQVDQAQFRLDDAQAIAIASDGKIYRSHVGVDGRFQLALATDATYTLRFANATADATKYDAFAVMVQQTADGSRHENFFLTTGDPIELGSIRRAGTISSALTAASEDDELDDEGESDDDSDTDSDGRRDDDITACDMSSGSDLVAVEAESSVLGDVDSDDDGVSDDEDSDDCDSDGDSDDEAAETEEAGDDDSDSDSDSEAEASCEDAAGTMEDACDQSGGNDPAPNPGGGAGTPDCTANPSDPGCL